MSNILLHPGYRKNRSWLLGMYLRIVHRRLSLVTSLLLQISLIKSDIFTIEQKTFALSRTKLHINKVSSLRFNICVKKYLLGNNLIVTHKYIKFRQQWELLKMK